MASNPLQGSVIGGGGIEIPTAGVDVATPTLQGAPVVQNRSISELMGAISSAAEAVTNVAQQKIRSDKITAQLNEKQKQDLENSEYYAFKKEEEVFRTAMQSSSPEIVQASDGYKDFKSRLSSKMEDKDRSPYFQAQIASLIADQDPYAQSLISQRENRLYNEERKQDRDGYELSKNIELQINEAISSGMPLEDAIKSIADPFREVPQVDFMARKMVLDDRSKKLTQLNEDLKDSAKNSFLVGASDVANVVATLTDPHLDDAQNLKAARSSVLQSISDMYGKEDYSLKSLIEIESAMGEMEAQMSATSLGGLTVNQEVLINAARAHHMAERTKFIDKITTKVKSSVDARIDLVAKDGIYSPEQAAALVEGSINGQLGLIGNEKVVTWNEKYQTFVPSNEEFSEIADGANKILGPLRQKWQAGAPKREAWQKILGTGPLRDDDLKTAGFTFKDASPFELAVVASRLPQGIGAGSFKTDIESVLDNPMLPDGTPDMENINKVLAVTKSMNISQSILLQGDSTFNEPRTAKLLRLSLWAAATEAKAQGRLSDVAQRTIFGSITGATQNQVDIGSLNTLLNAPMNPAGSEVAPGVLEPSAKDVLRRHPGLNAGHPAVNLLKQTSRLYMGAYGKALDDETMAMFDTQILKSFGISMYTATDGSLTLHADEYGHAPKDPSATARKALDYVPEKGSTLHTTAVANWKQTGPATEADLLATDGMSLRDIYNHFQRDRVSSDDVIVQNIAHFPDSQAKFMVDKGVKTGASTLSDYDFQDLFGFGVNISGGRNQNVVLKVNRSVEQMLDDPSFSSISKDRKKAARDAKDRVLKANEGSISRFVNNLLHPQGYRLVDPPNPYAPD